MLEKHRAKEKISDHFPLMDSETTNLKILMFPWLAHGHIFPYLELAKRILKRKNCHIHICSTSINFTSINNFIQHNSLENSIELVELHLPPYHELPPHYHTTKNLPSNLVSALLEAFQKSNSSFSEIITSLKPDLVIYDIFQPWAAKIASSKGVPAVHYAAFGAAIFSFIHHQYVCGPDDDFPSTAISLKNHERTDLDNFINFIYTNIFEEDKDVFFVNFKLSSDIVLLRTCRGFEGKYMDYLSGLLKKKQLVPIGPQVNHDHNRNDDEENSEIIQWLSKRTMPMKLDQPISARMLAEVGACMEVSTDENGVYKGEELAKAMKKVVIDKSGDELRLRAQELKEALDGAVEHLWQICMKNKRCKN
ncbi:hypothetical protein BUALT_Bualt12G0123700 [Buddleja alternifolia]|uniref:Glycosyltransferase N-terminal domain-containing protein n=1 Tax=Buddleja alternifolia TaxID=168488 RepID=A0AAV6X1E6_9LAMI|nr:hypothetical protein BUALT_Bualt12G0123700 [Buddleja alternifolia]